MATPNTYSGLVSQLIEIMNLLILLLFAVVMTYFVWKLVDSWVIHGGDQSKREEGKQYLWAAIIALVLMISAWGVVALLRTSLFG